MNAVVWSITGLLALAAAAHAAKAIPTTCSVCNGKVTEADRKYSVYIIEGMEPNAFDDIGCAVIWYAEQCGMRSSTFDSSGMAHDFLTGEAIPVENAYYAKGPDIKTPRGYGIVAFSTREAANRFASERGATVLDYQEVSSLKLK